MKHAFQIFYPSRSRGDVSDVVCAECLKQAEVAEEYRQESGYGVGGFILFERELDRHLYTKDDELSCDLCGSELWTLEQPYEEDPDVWADERWIDYV